MTESAVRQRGQPMDNISELQELVERLHSFRVYLVDFFEKGELDECYGQYLDILGAFKTIEKIVKGRFDIYHGTNALATLPTLSNKSPLDGIKELFEWAQDQQPEFKEAFDKGLAWALSQVPPGPDRDLALALIGNIQGSTTTRIPPPVPKWVKEELNKIK